MREIKFRYVIKDEEGVQSYITDPYDVYLTLEGELYTVDHERLDAKLIQYTGLKDKNGKEIYENDIVHIKHFYKNRQHTGKVVYCRNRYEVEGFYFPHYDDPSDAFEACMGSIEVIGNTYENPELIKQDEN